MKSVSRFELTMLQLLHFILGRTPWRQAQPLLEDERAAPRCLSRDAVLRVRDALSKGCVLWLTRNGAWRRERHLRNEKTIEGRLWERTSPADLELSFSSVTLELLVWLTSHSPNEDKERWECPAEPTVGDLFFCFLVHETLRLHNVREQLAECEPFCSHALIGVTHPAFCARINDSTEVDFEPWTTGVGVCVLEALQHLLVERWTQSETSKGEIADWEAMRRTGIAQERVLNALLDALEKTGRKDLARFLLLTAERVVTSSATAECWTESLSRSTAPGRLAERTETYRGATAFLRILPRLQKWERQARSVGYFDEDYAAAQLWKDNWERVQGDVLTERAQRIVRALDPMRQTEESQA